VTGLESDAARRTGDPERLQKAALAEVDAMRRRVGPKHNDYGITLLHLGELYTRLARYADAARTLSRARDIMVGSEEGWALRALTDLEEARGRPRDALAFLDAVERVWKHKYDAPRDEIAEERRRLRATVQSLPDPSASGDPKASAPRRMRHPKLGIGEVVSREGDRVRLRMDAAAERTFLADRLEAL
jgi:tetratricopeptide (TPR) repeat protein